MSQEETLVPSDTADPSAYDDAMDGTFLVGLASEEADAEDDLTDAGISDPPDGFDADEADENDFRARFDGSFGMALIALEAGHPVTNELLGANKFMQFLPGYRRPGKRINSVVSVETPICIVEFIPDQEHPSVTPWLNIPQAALLSRGWRIMD